MKHFSLLFLLVSLCTFSSVQAQDNDESAIFSQFLKYAAKENVVKKKTGDRILAIAKFFLDTPYVAHTLEAEGPERLQVNLHGFDCTTYVESVLALHQVLNERNPTYESFKRILTKIRYRKGIIDGYPSRLNYLSDWLCDNVHKHYFDFVKMGHEAEEYNPHVYFMSTHPNAYNAIKEDRSLIPVIADQEDHIDKLCFMYVPKEKLTAKAPLMDNGDIVAITTDLKGLDFSHVGFAVRLDDEVYLLHASSSLGKVVMSNLNLKEYLLDVQHHTGIVVVRPR